MSKLSVKLQNATIYPPWGPFSKKYIFFSKYVQNNLILAKKIILNQTLLLKGFTGLKHQNC